MTEKTTDLIISKLLDASSIEHYAESCPIEEINKAMVSKRGTGKKGFPEYLAISGDFVIVIEDKAKVEDQAKYLKDNETLLMDTSSVTKYAEMVRCIMRSASFKTQTSRKSLPLVVREQTRSALLFALFMLVRQVTKYFQRLRTSTNSQPRISNVTTMR